jgi:hypothetical protein
MHSGHWPPDSANRDMPWLCRPPVRGGGPSAAHEDGCLVHQGAQLQKAAGGFCTAACHPHTASQRRPEWVCLSSCLHMCTGLPMRLPASRRIVTTVHIMVRVRVITCYHERAGRAPRLPQLWRLLAAAAQPRSSSRSQQWTTRVAPW